MNQEFTRFRQRALLNWSSLTVEILATAILYATLVTFGVSMNISALIACIFAVLLVAFGLVFIYKIYPKIIEKPVKLSLLNDYLTLRVNNLSKSHMPYYEALAFFLDALESTFPLYKRTITMSMWSLIDSPHGKLSTTKHVKDAPKLTIKITYVDLKGRHIDITVDNPNTIEALDIISMLTKEVKESPVATIEQKKEQIEVIDQITKEVLRPEPNKTLLRVLSEGLASLFKSSPGMDKAASEANSLTSVLGN